MGRLAWMLFAAMCVFELIADVIGKKYAITGRSSFGWLAFVGYMAANTSWLYSMKQGFLLSLGGVYFGIITGFMCVVVGCLFYKEPVTKLQALGMILGIVSSGLMTMEGEK